ncbi:interleukin 2 receptor, gamma a [Astyanax mexicanus]|uniref:interleukin 2 receptor, gamma a n=1 Tax=Astyanax mexicanus TaxID=7994 RepID=UPI0020CAD0C2|nr:interleukin 2 receptor, gamma a [Astyanax mexicanus]
MTLLLIFVLFWTCSGSASEHNTSVKCMIIDLEYVNCTWGEDSIPQESYTFKSSFHSNRIALKECSAYLKVNGVNVGCVFSYKEKEAERFRTLFTELYTVNGDLVKQDKHSLINEVKLNPAFNLTVEMKNPELWLYWNISSRAKPHCVESEVQYSLDDKDCRSQGINSGRNSFNVPFPNTRSVYQFQVRIRMSKNCGLSEMWSDWSKPVCWKSLRNDTDNEPRSSSSVTLMVLYTVGAVVILLTLSCLLIHSERLRVILVPVVPNAGKNFAELIENYGGNVEKWINISKELQDGFKPNFTERTCPVREYQQVPQSSSSSESSLSGLTDVSIDYQPMHSYSSASTVSATTSTTQPTPTTPSML